MKLAKKTIKLVSELMGFCFKVGIKHIKIDVTHKCNEAIIRINGNTDTISSEEVERVRKALSTPREIQVEEYYWELAGESDDFESLSLVGMMSDKVKVTYEDDNLEITVHREK